MKKSASLVFKKSLWYAKYNGTMLLMFWVFWQFVFLYTDKRGCRGVEDWCLMKSCVSGWGNDFCLSWGDECGGRGRIKLLYCSTAFYLLHCFILAVSTLFAIFNCKQLVMTYFIAKIGQNFKAAFATVN